MNVFNYGLFYWGSSTEPIQACGQKFVILCSESGNVFMLCMYGRTQKLDPSITCLCSELVFLSLMVHQKGIQDKLVQELCCELTMAVWYAFDLLGFISYLIFNIYI